MPKPDIKALEVEIAELRRELEQVRAQTRLGQEGELLQRVFGDRMMLDYLPEVVCLLDRNQSITYLSRTVPEKSVDALIGTRAEDSVRPEHRARVNAAFERAWCSREPQTVDYIGMSDRWWQTRFVPIHRDGVVVRMLCSSLEIGERMRERTARRESDNRLQHATALVGMGTWTYDWSSDVLVWNEALCEMFGVTETPRTFGGFLALVHPDDRASVDVMGASGRETGDYYELEFRVVRPSGEVRRIRSKGGWQYDDEGNAFGALGAVFDVTERKRLEEQLSQRQKMEAVGELTAGVAHNFNNLLSIILPNVELCLEEAPLELGQSLIDIEQAALRAADLVRQLMLFVRRGAEVRKVPVDPVATVRDVVNICRNTFNPTIEVALEVAPNIPHILGNTGQLEQVVMNICINARDALIEARTPAAKLAITVERSKAGGVLLRLCDNGPGMSEHTSSRVFEPFFTTKPVGRGTGLGLATVYAIVRDHGGRITCDSRPGQGATFEIELPELASQAVSEPAAARTNAPSESPLRAQGGGETIAIVDDEPLVRRATRGMLVRHGYRVVECSNGEELLALFEAPTGTIDLVLLDQVLPGQSGERILSVLRKRAPEIPVVMMSGGELSSSASAQANAVLVKPVNTEVLLHAIGVVITHASRAGSHRS
jgi:PAS domain S-box-containing protein